MNEKIKKVLSRLEGQSESEKKSKVRLSPDQRMLAITPDTGKFINIILKSAKVKKILEVGMSFGYSTLWFADAVVENDALNGKIITIEQNSSKVKKATINFEDAGVSKFIEIRKGLALKELQELSKLRRSNNKGRFDFAFIDADKENTIKYFDLILPMIKTGGLIATDNMLYPEKYRAEMKKFVKHIKTYPNVQTVTIDIGNGEEITLKTS